VSEIKNNVQQNTVDIKAPLGQSIIMLCASYDRSQLVQFVYS